MNIGSLFSGIGGIELGFERQGFKTKWFVENNPYAQAVLHKHWPEVPIHGDIKTIDFTKLPKVEVLTGGFPCQDISVAGKGAGIQKGKRSSLWKEFHRAIREIRPKYALIENVPMLTQRGLNVVLADLAQIRYDAEWYCLRASDTGAIHRRERIFIIAHPTSLRRNNRQNNREARHFLQTKKRKVPKNKQERNRRKFGSNKNASLFPTDNWGKRVQRYKQKSFSGKQGFSWCKNVRRIEDLQGQQNIPEPLFRGGRDGIPHWVDRIKCLGNAVVPQCAEFFAEIIKEKEKQQQGLKEVKE